MKKWVRYFPYLSLFLFLTLVYFKYRVALTETLTTTNEKAIVTAIFTGFPQIILAIAILIRGVRTNMNVVFCALVAYSFIYGVAGYFPGMKPAQMGEAHFETPILLLLEMAIAVLAIRNLQLPPPKDERSV